MSEVILKDCPYCGACSFDFLIEKVIYAGPSKSSSKGGQVTCTKCGMQGPWMPSHIEAIEVWNALPRNKEVIDNPTPLEFKWGDKVEVRDTDEEDWKRAIYVDTIEADYPYKVLCEGYAFLYCYKYCRYAKW